MNRFYLSCVVGMVGAAALAGDIKLSLQAYTFRDRSFIETLKTAERLGFTAIESYPGQALGEGFEGTTDYNSMKPETVEKLKAHLAACPVKLVSYGVTGASSPEQWDKLMTFAKTLGIREIQISPTTDKHQVDLAEQAAVKWNINVGFHNHTEPEGQPAAMAAMLQGRDKRLGAGSDIGHWARTGVKPVEGVRLLKGRYVDMHFIDIEAFRLDARDVPLGSGVCDPKAVLDELTAQGYKGYVTLEYEYATATLEAEVAACVRWFRAWEKGELSANGKLPVNAVSALWDGMNKDTKPDTWSISDAVKESAAVKKRLAGLKLLAADPATVKGNKPGYNNEQPEKGIGTQSHAKYCQVWDGKAFVLFALKEPAKAVYYTLSSSNDSQSRDPAKWVVSGSGDGQNWETLDKQEGQIFMNRFQLKGFEIKAPKSYKWYRLEILEHGNDKDMQFSRFAVFGE